MILHEAVGHANGMAALILQEDQPGTEEYWNDSVESVRQKIRGASEGAGDQVERFGFASEQKATVSISWRR